MSAAPVDRLRDTARAWLAAGRNARIVRIGQARGSTPRAAGTRMLVAVDAVAGTIGGGHLELEAIRLARADLPHGLRASVFERRFALGPSLGQCCGGDLTLRFEPLTDEALTSWHPKSARFHLQLFGAGHVGARWSTRCRRCPAPSTGSTNATTSSRSGATSTAATCRATASSASRSTAWKPRSPAAPAGAFYLVMTHSHDLDLLLCETALRRGDAGFLGVIGSATKRARFERRLREHGLDDIAIEAMHCPVGIDGIEGKEPEIIAVAVVAELLRRSSS